MRLGQTDENREKRQTKLEEILEKANLEDKELSKLEIQKLLADEGFSVSLPTVYNDLKDISRNDSFIQELASTTYSHIMHKAFDSYNKIYTLAMKIHDSEEHMIKKIERETNKGTTHEVISENNASVKLQALTVAKNAQDSIRLMVNGENLHLSASKWIEATKQQEATIANLREKIKEYDDPKFGN